MERAQRASKTAKRYNIAAIIVGIIMNTAAVTLYVMYVLPGLQATRRFCWNTCGSKSR